MTSRQAVSAGARLSVAVKILDEELNKEEPDLRDLHIKMGKAKFSWLAYCKVYKTYNDAAAGEEETGEQLQVCLKEDGYNYLQEISEYAIQSVLELLDMPWYVQ